ncbi:uncharacterized protein LOC141585952 [Silene latifolia]|uniref:uncharacterized protein LOC141585952 n=1 Tax=Silene latifolia TaxID=37657 RepID=UPI003D787FF7
MHQKKSEVQIGKESSGISSDFNPSPPLLLTSLMTQIDPNSRVLDLTHVQNDQNFGSNLSPSATTPHKRNTPMMNPNNSIVKSPTLPISLKDYPFSVTPTSNLKAFSLDYYARWALSLLVVFSTAKSTVFRVVKGLGQLQRLRAHIRLVLLLALPFFYFLVSHPSHSFILDFLSAFAFSAALLFSLNLALPRLPSIRVFLNRSFHFPIKLKSNSSRIPRHLPVFWSIGSKAKFDKKSTSGCLVQIYSNGDVYEGEFHEGKCSGSGVYYYCMSGRYEGDWIDGKYDGYGVETWARGSRYRGQYKQGLRHGFGVYRFYTGDVYAGEWFNGQSHGCGIHTCEDGSRYVGEFKRGVKHGLGRYHFRNGDTYAGEYFVDKTHGFGVYKFANGHKYEGAWHEGRRQGLGMYTFRNGETEAGHWHNGILDVPSTQSVMSPVSPVGVNNSKVLNAVQEARVVTEKAYDIAKVDERVNRAVAAANRAANAARVAAVKAVQNQLHHHATRDRFPIPMVLRKTTHQ